jgi:hypothetical protein
VFLGEWSWGKVVNKLKRRVHTLLFPFLVWKLATLALFLVVHNIPRAGSYLSSTMWSPAHYSSFIAYVCAILGLSGGYPISHQLWFISDLMAFVILAPVIRVFLHVWKVIPYVGALMCAWTCVAQPISWPNAGVCLFFSVGAYLARRRELTCLDRNGVRICMAWIGLATVYSAFPQAREYCDKPLVLFGLGSLWWLSGIASRSARVASSLRALGATSCLSMRHTSRCSVWLERLCMCSWLRKRRSSFLCFIS